LVRLFETALKRRRRGSVIRLEIEAKMPEELRAFVQSALSTTDDEFLLVDGVLAMNELSQLNPARPARSRIRPYVPASSRARARSRRRYFRCDQAKGLIVHHPYESFDVVVQFCNRTAETRCRRHQTDALSHLEHSPIVRALAKRGAGKSVTALVNSRRGSMRKPTSAGARSRTRGRAGRDAHQRQLRGFHSMNRIRHLHAARSRSRAQRMLVPHRTAPEFDQRRHRLSGLRRFPSARTIGELFEC